MALAALSLAFAAGVFLGSLFIPQPALLGLALLPLPLLLSRRWRKTGLVSSVCLLLLFAGALHYRSSLPPQDYTQASYYNDMGTVTLRGVVSLDPDVQDSTTRLKLATQSIELDGEWHEDPATSCCTCGATRPTLTATCWRLRANSRRRRISPTSTTRPTWPNNRCAPPCSIPKCPQFGRPRPGAAGLDLFSASLAGGRAGALAVRAAGVAGAGHRAGAARQHTRRRQHRFRPLRHHACSCYIRGQPDHHRPGF